MRIVAGEFRSRVISAVEGNTTWPTTDKIKEAAFSCIGSYSDGGDMLNLFGGSGSMSLEVTSRGTEYALVCDVSHAAVSTIHKNVKTLDVASWATIWKMDYRQVLAKASQGQRTLDLAHLDSPYKKQQILHILQCLDTHDLVNELGDVVCESLKEDEFPDQVGVLYKAKDVVYGITCVTYHRKECMEWKQQSFPEASILLHWGIWISLSVPADCLIAWLSLFWRIQKNMPLFPWRSV